MMTEDPPTKMDILPIDVEEDHGKATDVDPTTNKLSTNNLEGKNELPRKTIHFAGPDFH